MASSNDAAHAEAIALLRARSYGTLATASAKHDQWPFASVMPYGFSASGSPVIYVAGIAEHTRNLKMNPKASLFVHPDVPAGVDAQTLGRLTLMAEAKPVPDEEREDAWARYVCRLPSATDYTTAHDFELWQLEPVHARYIGGFGRIFWLDAEAFVLDPTQDVLAASASGIIDHMNEDHLDAMELLCRAHFGEAPSNVKMVSVDQFGFDVTADQRRRRFEFSVPATPESVRGLVVDLVKEARAKTAT